MVEVIFLSLDVDETERATCEAAVHRFAEFVADPPLEITCGVLSIDRELRSRLLSACDEPDIAGVTDCIFNHLCDHLWDSSPLIGNSDRIPKVVIACDGSSQLTQKVRQSNPNALWGGSDGWVSFVYQHNPVVVWHEMFHLLGAKDCYVVGETRSVDQDCTCGKTDCIMQYAPVAENVGDPPFICEDNVKHIREQGEAKTGPGNC